MPTTFAKWHEEAEKKKLYKEGKHICPFCLDVSILAESTILYGCPYIICELCKTERGIGAWPKYWSTLIQGAHDRELYRWLYTLYVFLHTLGDTGSDSEGG